LIGYCWLEHSNTGVPPPTPSFHPLNVQSLSAALAARDAEASTNNATRPVTTLVMTFP
jgi:hypothetical protein